MSQLDDPVRGRGAVGTALLMAPSEVPQRTANVESQFEATGFAQVLVVLSAAVAPGAAAAAAATEVTTRGARRGARRARGTSEATVASAADVGLADMAQYFVVPPEAQDAALAHTRMATAAAKVQRSVRGRRAGRAAATGAALERVVESAETTVPKVRVFPHLGVMLGTVDRAGLAAVQNDPRVEEVQGTPPISLIRPTLSVAAKKASGVTWGLQRLKVPEMWAAGFTGKGVLVGHLDTGIDAKHPALKGAVKSYAEFDMLGNPVPNAKPRDSGEHGTHTAGTIAARAVGTTSFGVAPDAKLASAMVIEGGNVIARILAGMDWVVGQGAQVLSMSLGLRGFTPAFLTLSRLLRARGVLPVFAVGNEGPGTSRSPGNYIEALSVGATDAFDAVASFSSSQTFARPHDPLVPDLVAPGVAVLSCVPNGGYAEMSGTSMATPHVAGLAALLMQATGASADRVEKALFDSCALSPGMLPERGNRGIPDTPRAYELLTGVALPAKPPAVKKPKAKKPKKPTAKKKAAVRKVAARSRRRAASRARA